MSLKESIQNKLSGRFTLAKVVYLRLKYFFMPADPELKKLKDTHKGEKCYVVALGPSLTVEDLNLLKEHQAVCFSVNGIFGDYSGAPEPVNPIFRATLSAWQSHSE